jgi:RNA polymerase sigma factor for flagellar operon FliA
MTTTPAEELYSPRPSGLAEQDPAAVEAAVRAHLPLVRSVVRRLLLRKPPHIEAEELMNWGLDGLLTALQRYDPSRGVAFEAYARPRIRGAVLDRLRATDFMARGLRRKAKRLERTYEVVEARLGRPATEEEIAAELQIEVSELHELLVAIGQSGAVGIEDLGVPLAAETPAIEEIVDESRADPLDVLLSRERVQIVSDAIQALPERERTVVALYYREEITMREVAAVMGVTESRVSQLHSQALLRLGGRLNRHFRSEGR